MPAAPSAGTPNLAERLDIWVAERVISRADAEAIAAFETRRAPVPGGRGVTPVTEALAYLGAALAIAAGATVLGGEWDGLSTAGRIAVSGTIWLVLFGVGWYIHGATSPPRIRLARVLWALSVASLAWTVSSVVADGFRAERWPLWSGAAAVLFAGALYLARPSTLQQLALVGGLILLAVGLAEDSSTAMGVSLWAVGAAWILLGWRRLLVEPETASTVGSLLMLIGALLFSIGHEEVGAWLSVLTAAGLIGVSVGIRHTAMLVLGAIGLFFSTFGTIQQYVEGTTGIAIGLLVAGVVVLALALVVSRLTNPTRWRIQRGPASLG
ncbi:MAG TPA: hypothetical protein VFI35_06945 [Actinomycetota bacterium]|nr:hypothetical protein [Actinomycetota bacterium]